MNHLTESQLNEYLDHSLDESTHRALDAHLEGCDECRENLNQLQDVFLALKSLLEIRLTRDLSHSIPSNSFKQPVLLLTRTLALQLGAVMGALIWLSVELAGTLNIALLNLGFQQLIVSPSESIAVVQAPILDLLLSIRSAQDWGFKLFKPEIKFPSLQFPVMHYQIPAYSLDLSAFHIVLLTISALGLWVVGNAFLLRNRNGLQR